MIGSAEKLPTKLLVSCMAIRLITSGVDMVQLGLLIHAFHPIGFIAVLATYPLILLINTFPITISGIGVREGAAAFLLSFFGIPASAAVMASFLLFCINTLLPGIVGAFLASQCVKRNVRG